MVMHSEVMESTMPWFTNEELEEFADIIEEVDLLGDIVKKCENGKDLLSSCQDRDNVARSVSSQDTAVFVPIVEAVHETMQRRDLLAELVKEFGIEDGTYPLNEATAMKVSVSSGDGQNITSTDIQYTMPAEIPQLQMISERQHNKADVGQTIVYQPAQISSIATAQGSVMQLPEDSLCTLSPEFVESCTASMGLISGNFVMVAPTEHQIEQATGKIPIPSLHKAGEQVYVNPKQCYRILKRREARAKLEALGRIPKERKRYLHESRHKHAKQRKRDGNGRFGSSS